MKQRLQFVRQYISSCLNACPPGKIRVVSVCAGDGRDLLGALIDHPRASDVYARLVELDQRLVECGRAAAESSGQAEQFEFVQGDATMSSVYEGAVPGDLVLVCGVFGNLPPLEVHRLVRSLCCLCKHGGFVIWTRGLFEAGDDSITIVRELLRESEFEEVSFKTTPNGRMGVGTHRYLGQTLPLPYDQQLFVFSSPLEIQEG